MTAQVGKAMRLKRVIDPVGVSIICALDHGMTSPTFLEPLADIVKTNWPGDPESFGKLVEAANGIPVVLAGGSRLEDEELLWRMQVAVEAGAIGCSVGRNIFMHASPEAITRALSRVIRERWSAEKAHDALVEELG